MVLQLVAFKSLLSRNKSAVTDAAADDDDNDDDMKVKLPFIVVNTNKDTVIDCWLSADRYVTLSVKHRIP